ncbi:zwei Ig domain protein zig-8-like isoform X3 [Ruditapes philippinarum]|uniref:zwei Ig domain protein zig-8-like isoform X3 n=1 Tax=Ruditapes philippinarum TaxID=129788 RepID=UPI00295BB1BD|nr:zwei Ig domain protein zig-8-like isoform X3 [Ruditapes philippinarum]
MDVIGLFGVYIWISAFSAISCYSGNLFQSTLAPEFLPAPFNVSFHVGDSAMLSCGINNLGTKTVVWRRLDSSFPLTSGKMTVIDDKRVRVSHVVHKNQWDLMIKDVKLEDDGVYECQISSKDRTVRRLVTLHVFEPKVEIPEINITEPQYVERGETITLQCNATGESYPPDEMDWFRNGQAITSDTKRGIHISKQYSISKRKFTSVLKIDRAEMKDDGTYVCRSSNMQITSTKVIVLNAETSPRKRGTAGGSKSDGGESNSSSHTMANSTETYLLNIVLICITVFLQAKQYCPS